LGDGYCGVDGRLATVFDTGFYAEDTIARWAAFISPVFITIYQLPLRFLPSSVLKGWLLAAGFNIAYLIFFILLLLLFKKPAAQETVIDS